MSSRWSSSVFVVGAVLVLVAVACGDSDDGVDPFDPPATTGSEPPATTADAVLADDFSCDERVSFHGDPTEDFVGLETREEAIAEAADPYGSPAAGDDVGTLWLVHDDQGRLVAKIEIVAAPGGGFMAGDHELCADAEPEHPEEGGEIVEGLPAGDLDCELVSSIEGAMDDDFAGFATPEEAVSGWDGLSGLAEGTWTNTDGESWILVTDDGRTVARTTVFAMTGNAITTFPVERYTSVSIEYCA